jgi:hypothetical protein
MEKVGNNQGLNQFICDGLPYPGTTKRIMSTADLGFVLVGSMKVTSKIMMLVFIQSINTRSTIHGTCPTFFLTISKTPAFFTAFMSPIGGGNPLN